MKQTVKSYSAKLTNANMIRRMREGERVVRGGGKGEEERARPI